MYSETYKTKPSVAGLLVIAPIIVIALVYAATAMNTGDLLWFWPRNENQPSGIVIHCYSEDVIVDPASNHYTAITTLVNNALSGQRRWDPLSLSDITYEEYLSHPKMMTLEVSYPRPVRIHTNTAFFSNVEILLIPLDARHAAKNAVFGRTELGYPAAGSLIIESTAVVKDYLDTQGICEVREDSWGSAADAPTQN